MSITDIFSEYYSTLSRVTQRRTLENAEGFLRVFLVAQTTALMTQRHDRKNRKFNTSCN